MANNPETGSQPVDLKVAKFVKEKSLIVGGIALVVGILVPKLAPIALKVAAFEGAQWGVAKVYEVFRAPTRQKAVVAA